MHSETANDTSSSFGNSLRLAREKNGLSRQAVAEKLNLNLKLIDALEEEDKSALPSATYVRGYIRSYAQLLNCDSDILVNQFNKLAGNEPTPLKVNASISAEKNSADPIVVITTVVVAALLVALLLIWGYEYVGSEKQSVAEAEVASFEEDADPVNLVLPEQQASILPEEEVATELQGASPQESIVLNSENSQVTGAQDNQETLSLNDIVQQQQAANRLPGNDALNINIESESWLEIFDANGQKLAFGLYNSGELPLKGQAPFQIIIGKADGVAIQLNGQPFDLAPHIKSDNTARLQVGTPSNNN